MPTVCRRFPMPYQISGWGQGFDSYESVVAYVKDKRDASVLCFRTYNNVSLLVIAPQPGAQLYLHLQHC